MDAADDQPTRLRCSKCHCPHLSVVRTAAGPPGRILLVRECRNCGQQTSAFERLATNEKPPVVEPELTEPQRMSLLEKLWRLLGF